MPAPSLRRIRLFRLLTALIVVVALELISLALLTLGVGGSERTSGLSESVDPETASASSTPLAPGTVEMLQREVIHPYLGYVLDAPFQVRAGESATQGIEYGFAIDQELFQKRQEGRLVVALTGGSLAFSLGSRSSDLLHREIGAPDSGTARSVDEVVLLNLALPGYKQPQQLMLLTYLLALGAQFDLVVNIDGFNEIALPPAENLDKGVSLHFPRSWYFRVNPELDPEIKIRVEEVAYLKRDTTQRAARLESSPARYSSTWRLLYSLSLQRQADRRNVLESELVAAREQFGAAYVVTGPRKEYPDMASMYDELVRLWATTSRLMHQLCTTNGIRYFHFLQPNQYVADTKPMGDAERRLALSQETGWGRFVKNGYPKLIEAVGKLRDQGVPVYDLTELFADVDEPIYEDGCCHINREGEEFLSRAIGTRVLRP